MRMSLSSVGLLGALVLGCASAPAASEEGALSSEASIPLGPGLSAVPIPGVPAYVIRHETPIAANSLLFITEDGTPVLADTPWTPVATRALLDWVERKFGRRPGLATVSHFHHDAAGGTGPLLEAGVTVVSSRKTSDLVRTRSASMQEGLVERYGAEFEGWSVPPPDRILAGDEETFEIGGSRIVVLFPGAAHAPGNIVTWFPQHGLLFGGCLVKGGKSLGYLGDADLSSYPGAVERLIKLSPKIVVAGHGPRLDSEQLQNTRRMLQSHKETKPAESR